MSKIKNAMYEIYHMDALAARDQWVNRVHPLVKLILTVIYIVAVVSFPKYDLFGLLGMTVYPIALFILSELSLKDSLRRLRVVLPLVCVIGVLNPIFDHATLKIGTLFVNAGVISMVTLMVKGVFTVLASYLLIATTSIEQICYALRLLHVPKILVTQILLTYRYISVLLGEVNRITQAYVLRAPKQKGIHYKVWGSLAGQLLLRSMDRANSVYESMTLRGYDGDFRHMKEIVQWKWSDVVYVGIWLSVILLCWKIPLILVIGNLVGGY